MDIYNSKIYIFNNTHFLQVGKKSGGELSRGAPGAPGAPHRGPRGPQGPRGPRGPPEKFPAGFFPRPGEKMATSKKYCIDYGYIYKYKFI